MRSADLKGIKPFITAIEQIAASLNVDYSKCACTMDITTKRWTLGPSCKGAGHPCHTVNAVAIRSYLAMMRLTVDHLDDVELEPAIRDVHALVLTAPRVSATNFQIRMHEALRVPMPDTETIQSGEVTT